MQKKIKNMFKRVLIALALTVGLQMMSGFAFSGTAFADDDPTAPAPSGSIDSASFMFDLGGITHEGIEGSTRQSWIRRGVNYFFERAIGFMAAIIGSLSVLMLSVGGFMMLASGGNETMYEKGKNFAKYALIGLGVTLLAYVMVTLVQLLVTSLYG